MTLFYDALLIVITLLIIWFAGYVVYRLKNSAR